MELPELSRSRSAAPMGGGAYPAQRQTGLRDGCGNDDFPALVGFDVGILASPPIRRPVASLLGRENGRRVEEQGYLAATLWRGRDGAAFHAWPDHRAGF